MANIKKVVGNYADSIWYACRDTTGYMIGGTTTAPTAGSQTGAPMLQLTGLQDFPFEVLDPDTPSQLGDGGVLARFINKPTELPEASLTMGASDFTFYALATAQLTHNVAGGTFVGLQGYNPTFQDLIILAYSQGKALDTGEVGSSYYDCRLILNVNAYPKGRNGFNTSGLPTYGYKLVANHSEYYPWGHAFTDGDEGDTQFVAMDFTWPYKPMIERWTGNNTETTYNLTKNIASDATTNIAAFVNGTAVTYVAGAPGAGEFGITESTTDTIVFGTAPAAAAKIVVIYGWS